MMHTLRSISIIIVTLALSFACMSCVSQPSALERISSEDCIVVIPCTITNPQKAPIGRTFYLYFNDGRARIKIEKTALSYLTIRISEPGLAIGAIKSDLEQGFTGEKTQYDLDIALPYERGKVIVSDYTFDQMISMKNETIWIQWQFLDTNEDNSARCLSMFMKSNEASSWTTSN